MKKFILLFILLLILIFVFFKTCNKKDDNIVYKPIRSLEFADDPSAKFRYRLDQMIVFYKNAPTEEATARIREAVVAAGINGDSISVRRCHGCDSYAELWSGKGIHSVIHAEGIKLGSSGGSRPVGEDSIARYSLNYLTPPPIEKKGLLTADQIFEQAPRGSKPVNGNGRDTIIVAVLDTGIDTTRIVNPLFLWTNQGQSSNVGSDGDGNCFLGDRRGWNFVNNTPNIQDDNTNLHGTLVSKFIADEVSESTGNFVQIMTLKTHDNTGYGDLFNSICALHYAIDNGVHVINASWGFYYYDENPHPYLDSLITNVLPAKGILFITASGNRIEEVDQYAKDAYFKKHNIMLPDTLLRNLELHNFYPACLSKSDNNVIVVTTTDSHIVSPTQNYSSTFVDIGVAADSISLDAMKFKLPLPGSTTLVSGSSFATAIAAGKIAAWLPKSYYHVGISKDPILTWLIDNSASQAIPLRVTLEQSLADKKRIALGRNFKR